MNAQTPESESELDRLRRLGTQAQGAVDTARQGFSLLGSLFSVAMWVGLAVVVWNVMPQQWRESIADMIPQEWRDMAVSFINRTTGLFGEQALGALERMDPTSETVVNQLEEMGITGELQDVVQEHWAELIQLSAANGGDLNNIITEGVITELFTNPANRDMAADIVRAIGTMAGEGGEIPDVLKTPLEAFINGEGFEQVMNNESSRALLFQALVNIAPEGEDLPTVAELERIYTELELTPDQLRSIAVTALNGADLGEAMQALMADPAISERLRENPELRTAVAGERADELGALLEVQGMLTEAGFTAAQMETIATALQGDTGVQGALAAMFTVNAEAANALLGNAANLEQLAALLPADADSSNPVIALLGTTEGRSALSTLVTDLAASNVDAPKQLLEAISLTDEAARNTAIMRIAGNVDSLNALKAFNTNIQGINDPALEELKAQLAPIAGTTAEIAGAAAQAAEEAPQLMAAMEAIAAASAANPNGYVGALMDDNTRNALLGEDGSLDALARMMVAQNGEGYVTERTTVNGEEGQHRLAALYNLISTIDAGTGGAQGSAEEIRADAQNGKAIAFLSAWLSPGSEMETINDPWSSADKEFRVTTADGQSYELSAREMEAFFNRHLDVADAQGRPMAMGTVMNNFFADMYAASPAGSAGRELFSFLVDNFWVDRNGNNAVDRDEGIKAVFNDADAIGLALSGANWSAIFNGNMRRYGDELTEMRDLMENFASELGEISAPRIGGRTAQERFDISHP